MSLSRFYYSFPTLHQLLHLIPPGLLWKHRAVQAILQELSAQKGITGKILEIGCGSGSLSQTIAKSFHDTTIYAVDSSDSMISYASRRNCMANLKFLNLDFLRISESHLRFDKFDVVVSLNAWSFFELEPSIRVLSDISRRGTRLIAVTYSDTLWSKFHSRVLSFGLKEALHLHQPSEFLSVLNNFGFEAEHIKINSIEGSYLVRAVRLR